MTKEMSTKGKYRMTNLKIFIVCTSPHDNIHSNGFAHKETRQIDGQGR